MNSRTDPLRLLMPMANALQFSLFLCPGDKKGKSKKPTIKGHSSFDLPVTDMVILPFKSKVIASGIGDKEAYVIVEVMGNMWALLHYDAVMLELGLSLLDSEKLPTVSDVYSHKTVKEVYDMVLLSVVGMWMRDERGETWSRLDEVESVGKPPMDVPEEASRPTDSISEGSS